MTEEMAPTPYQARVLSVPETVDLFLGGGRGGGKSHCKALLILRHVEQYREKARVLYVRRTYKGLADFELVLRSLFSAAYGSAASYNSTEHVFRLPYGYVELAQVDSPGAYDKVQGRSFTLIMVDELTQWADPLAVDMLRSNLRGPKDVPLRTVYAGNPGGAGHHWVASRYVLPGRAWVPFATEAGGLAGPPRPLHLAPMQLRLGDAAHHTARPSRLRRLGQRRSRPWRRRNPLRPGLDAAPIHVPQLLGSSSQKESVRTGG